MSAQDRVNIIIVGASGDLARRKIVPALFSLHCHGLLPADFRVVGFARSAFTDDEFRSMLMENLTCRYVPEKDCSDAMDEFLARCVYVAGQYNSEESFGELRTAVGKLGGDGPQNNLFYLAIPPSVFIDTARSIRAAGFVADDDADGWLRVVIEKPFGHDAESSAELTNALTEIFGERRIYRIDHYLGKEVIQNLMVLRFANLIFEPLWNHATIHSVQISWAEDFGIGDRSGYFDQYGIIRDVIQNHLMQILALVAMEQPVGLNAADIGDEKVKVLRCVPPVTRDDIVLGQYTAGEYKGAVKPAYLQEKGVPAGSRTDTYAAMRLHIRNRRWDGVPFLIRAGKALSAKTTEIRIRFRDIPGNIFSDSDDRLDPNELVIRVQPDEAIYFRIANKVPGLTMTLDESNLDLQYGQAYDEDIPDAYERLLLDVLKGDKSLFIRDDELSAAWNIFSPLLHEIADGGVKPELYAYGGSGPSEADAVAERVGARWSMLGRDE